jgi:hypothetical protein
VLSTKPLGEIIGTEVEGPVREAINGFELLQLDKSDDYLQLVRRL